MISIDNLYEHQKKYYKKLQEKENEIFHAIVCIPTGGGKTRLAAIYAINEVLEKGKKVLWITHSKYLLNQAYATFYNYLGYEWMKNYGILVHSDNTFEFRDKDTKEVSIPVAKSVDIASFHKLIFVSFQSLQKCNRDWRSIIGEDVVIIVDEAHHIVAERYMNIISDYSKQKSVLGLTATPIRTKMAESNDLYQYFETDLGVRVHITTLFEKKILVRAIVEDVEFSMDTSDIFNVNDLTSGLIKEVVNYNQLILEQYMKHENRYGKTVIFAINKEHVDSLYELFHKKYGGRVFRVYSNLSDREIQFQAFQESKDGILINVNIMNEGVDIPDIHTVFMTKPLNSRIMVTQIIGRALRKAEGKNIAHVVNFAVSNLGKKFLMVSPKLAYKLYEAEWNEDDREIDELEMEEENMDSIAKLVKEHMERKAVCTFSNICLAGHYTIIAGEDCDIPVPVSFIEYRMIERYIAAKKAGKITAFPNKLFFCEEVESVHHYIDSAIDIENKDCENGENIEIVFKKYDETIFQQFEMIYEYARNLEEEIRRENLKEMDVRYRIVSFYKDMQTDTEQFGDVLSYLSQIGANSESHFVRLIRNELVSIKYGK